MALAAVVLLFASFVLAEGPGDRRVTPPEWPQDVLDIFFDDAREALSGSRPNYRPNPATQAGTETLATGGAVESASSSYRWSDLIDADTIESEIKRLASPLGPLVATPSAFKGGGYRDCRDHFSWLAVLFTVAGQFDEPIRWKKPAEAWGQLFARAGFNCKVGTDQSFRESQLRVQDLADLVRGGRPTLPSVRPDVGWDQIADLAPLMRRMEGAIGEQISPNVSDQRSLKKNADDLYHEAQLLALLAQVIAQDGWDYSDEESYLAEARKLRDASVEFSQATEQNDFAAARQALGQMKKACSDCHDEWR